MRAATYAGGCATTAYSRLDATTVPVSSVRFAEFKWVRWRWGLSARVVPCLTSELYTAYWKLETLPKLDPSVQLMPLSLIRLLPNLAPLDDFGAWFSAATKDKQKSKVTGPVHPSTSH